MNPRRERDSTAAGGAPYTMTMKTTKTNPATPVAMLRHRVITPPPGPVVELPLESVYHIAICGGEVGSPTVGRYEMLTRRPPKRG